MSFDLHYFATGEGQPFIFQHGLGAQAQQAQGLLAGLEGVQLISMDCRGHGKSPLNPNIAPSFEAYTQDVIRMMDHLKIERAIFGGISMGSGISLRMALQFPERVKGLVLVRPAWLDQGIPENLAILLEVAHLIDTPDGKAAFEALPYMQEVTESLPRVAASIMGLFARDQQQDTALVLNHMVQDVPFSHNDALHQLDLPCLLIANDKDPLHPYELAAEIATLIPGSQLKRVTSRYVADAAHREEVRQIVSTFITEHL